MPSSRYDHVALLKSDLNPEQYRVTIRSAKQKPGAPTKSRIHTIPGELMDILVEVVDRSSGKYVFPQNQSLAQLFDRILERACIPKKDDLGRKLVAHSFRHTYATMMSEAVGGNPFILKQALGHSQISTRDRYCHPHTCRGHRHHTLLCTKRMQEWGRCGGDGRKHRTGKSHLS
jgi:integrase